MCVIPARGGSKEIYRKNIKELVGKPLLAWTIEASLRATRVDKTVVSTNDEEIGEVAEKYGAEIHWRSEENSRDNVHSVHAVLECLDFYEKSGIIVNSIGMLLATSPLRTKLDIDTVFNILDKGDCDSVVSVTRFEKPVSSLRHMGEDEIISPIVDVDNFEVQRQDISKPLFEVNGSMFVSTAEHLKKVKSFHKGRVKGYKMARSYSIDINSLNDWSMAEAILQCRK